MFLLAPSIFVGLLPALGLLLLFTIRPDAFVTALFFGAGLLILLPVLAAGAGVAVIVMFRAWPRQPYAAGLAAAAALLNLFWTAAVLVSLLRIK